MKRILCVLLITGALFLLLWGCSKNTSTSPSSSPQWRVVGNAGGFSPGAASYTSLYVYNNTPYVAFVDATANSRATVMDYNGSSWVTNEYLASPTQYTSVFVYGGTPYVTYQDYLNEMVMYNIASNKYTTTNAISSMSSYLSGTNGTSYIAYVSNSTISVITYTGVSWTSIGNAFGQTSLAPSMCVSNGVQYVAYVDSSSNSIYVMTFTGGTWAAVGGSSFGRTQSAPSLSVEGGTPYVAFSDTSSSGYGRAAVEYYSGGWVPYGGADFSEESVNYLSLQLYNQIPYVAFQDNANSSKVTVMTCASAAGQWTTVGSKAFSAGAAQYISLFINNGTPCVAYCDGANYNKATMMYYH